EPDVGVDGYMVDALQLVFDRILRGHDIGVRGVDRGKGRVQGGGFSGTRGAGHQDHPERRIQGFPEIAQALFAEAHFGHVQVQVALVQYAHHHLFAVDGGKHAHAQIDFLEAEVQLDAAVLRQAALGDVQVRHDLDARYD